MDTDRIKGSTRDVVGKVEEGAGSLLNDSETRARGMVDQAAGTVQNAYGRAKDTARDLTDQARDASSQARDMGAQYYDQGTRALRDTVQAQPIGALMLAAAAGFLLAWVLQTRD